jgi:thioredoxin 1
MQFFNHYSALIIPALLLAAGAAVVMRHGGKLIGWLVLGGVMLTLVVAWFALRPVAKASGPDTGQPVLLEIQSPYCLGCVAMKPAVDRLEEELRDKLIVRRVDIQSAEGRQLVKQYGIEFTPTFLLFDAAGKEQWRSVGQLDAARVRASLEKQHEAR